MFESPCPRIRTHSAVRIVRNAVGNTRFQFWRQKTLRILTCEKKFERYVTRLLSGERDLDLYTPALWFGPEPHFWVETRLKQVGLQNFHSAGGTLKIWRRNPDVTNGRSVHDPTRFGTNQHSPSLYHTARVRVGLRNGLFSGWQLLSRHESGDAWPTASFCPHAPCSPQVGA